MIVNRSYKEPAEAELKIAIPGPQAPGTGSQDRQVVCGRNARCRPHDQDQACSR